MPNINTANIALTGATTKRTIGTRLNERWLSVKDFGATGNGTTADNGYIQAAFDYLFGPEEDPKGSESWDNPPIYFPPGNYKITQPLKLNVAHGPVLIGAGSHQTRLFWSGGEVEGEDNYVGGVPDGNGPISSLIESKTTSHVHVEGITFDASDVQDVAYRLMRFSADVQTRHSGTDAFFRDVHFTNAVTGFLAAGDIFGSEQAFTNCSFTNCQHGHFEQSANALNHSFYHCYFGNNEIGMKQTTGGSGVVWGCVFDNNSVIDINHLQCSLHIANCSSTSQNFVSADGVIVGCRHVNASPGLFWTGNYIPGVAGSNNQIAVIKGCYSSNGFIDDSAGSSHIVMLGNIFDNPDYVDEIHANTKLSIDGDII